MSPLELIAELKAAPEASRVLDQALARLLGWQQKPDQGWRWSPDGLAWMDLPHWTASLDELQPLLVDRMWATGRDEDGKGCAELPRERILASAATPPLALCLALVQAHVQQKGGRL